jgi:hypothetical protein
MLKFIDVLAQDVMAIEPTGRRSNLITISALQLRESGAKGRIST